VGKQRKKKRKSTNKQMNGLLVKETYPFQCGVNRTSLFLNFKTKLKIKRTPESHNKNNYYCCKKVKMHE